MTDISYKHAHRERETFGHPEKTRFHIVSVGWGASLITGLLDQIEARTDYRISHIVFDPDLVVLERQRGLKGVYRLRDHPPGILPQPDAGLLGSLERPGVPTIHNMIMSDRVVRHLPYDQALAYSTYIARRLTELFQQLEPSVVIGGFDGLHGAIGLAVARKLDLPWFAMNFTPLPSGMSGFCTGLTPRTAIKLGVLPQDRLRALADRTLAEFEKQERAVPAYGSANSATMLLRRLPQHIGALYNTAARWLSREVDRFTDVSALHLVKEYARKRMNLFFLPRDWFCSAPPRTSYVFFGLHKQPEGSIDVWAPSYSNQLSVVEALARAIPPTHGLLVKLHKSDADNYSRGQLDQFRRLPGVRLVSPFAQSRPFLDSASLVVAIQGTIALEAGLLGKPVIMFGDSTVLDLPSVSRAGSLHELPELIRRKLVEPSPEREEIVRGFTSYLSHYSPGCYNDWNRLPSQEEIGNLVVQFEALHGYVERQGSVLEVSPPSP